MAGTGGCPVEDEAQLRGSALRRRLMEDEANSSP
jgi:hypothetical protein